MRKNVGVIGLGIIGSRVAAHLREKGFHVFVWNRTLRRVPNFVGNPAEIAEMCDYIQIFVSDDDALLDVTNQLTSALAPRHIVLAHSTVSPHSMRAAAEIVERRGARFIEAPFTGSKMAAEKGELVYYVGGDDAALREARPILEASSKEIMVIGEIGQATAVKIATNMVTAASVEAAAEALALAQTVGLSLDKFVEAMRGNASYSQTLAMKLPKMAAAVIGRYAAAPATPVLTTTLWCVAAVAALVVLGLVAGLVLPTAQIHAPVRWTFQLTEWTLVALIIPWTLWLLNALSVVRNWSGHN